MISAGSASEQMENLTGGTYVSSDLPIETDIPLAAISKATYDNYTSGVKTAQKTLDEYTSGYNILEDYTSPEYVTAINEDEQKIVIGFRGTDVNNIYDLIADAQITAGFAETSIPSYVPSRFKSSEKVYKQVKEMYPEYDLTLTGHSLGGTVARYIGDRYSEKAVVFSAGATPLEPFIENVKRTFNFKPKTSSAKYYLTDTLDVISNTSRLTESNVVSVKQKSKKYITGSHDIMNYLPNHTYKHTPKMSHTHTRKMTPKNEYVQVDYNPFKISYCELYPEKCYPD